MCNHFLSDCKKKLYIYIFKRDPDGTMYDQQDNEWVILINHKIHKTNMHRRATMSKLRIVLFRQIKYTQVDFRHTCGG